MLPILVSVLVGSSVSMALLLYAKHWELATGRMLLPSVRPRLESASARMLAALERHLPMVLRRVVSYIGLRLRFHARDLVARVLLMLERTLEATLEQLKHGLSPVRSTTGEASSAFLREVAEHKRRLTRVARMRRTEAEIRLPE